MNRKTYALLAGLATLLAALLLGCNGSNSQSTSAPAQSGAYTYATTSAVGDFAKWTIDSSVSPATFSVVWNVIDTTGNVSKTMNIAGTCGNPDTTYYYRLCTVSSSSDANVQIGGQYHMLEVPGVALFVHPTDVSARGSGTGQDEVHVGFTLGSCNDTRGAGDYVFSRILPVSNPFETEMLGLSRVSSSFIANNFNGDLLHAGFAVEENSSSFKIIYNLASGTPGVNDQGSANGVDSFTGNCSDGVMTMTQVAGGMHQRGVITPSGLMFMDGPENWGGLIMVKTSVAATADDLAGKTLIVVWQNSSLGNCDSSTGCTDLIRVTFGAKDATGRVPATFSPLSGRTIPTMGFRAASDPNAGIRFLGVNSGYQNNALSQTYPQPANIPALFYSDETTTGNETPTFVMVAKVNGKLLLFGNNSARSNSGPCLNNTATCDRATGNFVGFEP